MTLSLPCSPDRLVQEKVDGSPALPTYSRRYQHSNYALAHVEANAVDSRWAEGSEELKPIDRQHWATDLDAEKTTPPQSLSDMESRRSSRSDVSSHITRTLKQDIVALVYSIHPPIPWLLSACRRLC